MTVTVSRNSQKSAHLKHIMHFKDIKKSLDQCRKISGYLCHPSLTQSRRSWGGLKKEAKMKEGRITKNYSFWGAERGKTRTSEGEWILSVAYETLEGLIMWFLTRSDKRNSWYLTDLTGAHGAIMSWCCSSLPVDFVEYNSRPFSLLLFIYHCLAGAQFPSFMGEKYVPTENDV